jgi:hypothetical protein
MSAKDFQASAATDPDIGQTSVKMTRPLVLSIYMNGATFTLLIVAPLLQHSMAYDQQQPPRFDIFKRLLLHPTHFMKFSSSYSLMQLILDEC